MLVYILQVIRCSFIRVVPLYQGRIGFFKGEKILHDTGSSNLNTINHRENNNEKTKCQAPEEEEAFN